MSVTWWTRGDTFVGAPDGRDGANHSLLYDDTDLPVVDTINGIQVSLATDYQTARSAVTQYPAIAGDVDGYFAWIYDDADLPYAFTSDGVEIVLDDNFAAAEQTWSGTRPAIVYGVAGYGEVKH